MKRKFSGFGPYEAICGVFFSALFSAALFLACVAVYLWFVFFGFAPAQPLRDLRNLVEFSGMLLAMVSIGTFGLGAMIILFWPSMVVSDAVHGRKGAWAGFFANAIYILVFIAPWAICERFLRGQS